MYAKKRPLWRILLMIGAVALICALIGSAVAKYIYTEELTAQITITANLAESVELWEHNAVRKDDGSYELGMEKVQENTYYLIPGLDVPKDPHIVITGKSPVEAYLFVEVVDKLSNSDSIKYTIDSEWEKLDGVTGKNGGTVYVYKKVLDAQTANYDIPILAGDIITVSDQLLITDNTATDVLTFYGYLGEVAPDATPEEVYNQF